MDSREQKWQNRYFFSILAVKQTDREQKHYALTECYIHLIKTSKHQRLHTETHSQERFFLETYVKTSDQFLFVIDNFY